ncbi:LacI family DNA-binding transcriptional regulator [Nocardioides sp. URHA0020]|uniref:LacI family DNA-binding transcriptional regulator n=1 Tax=Nocardioides sp. URHA0020 TaxID=1380392 RepID=UPI000687CA3A|nr:LacI family DNA-binding transcriptional regulator [Nocardioides sp. URHA0020]
MSVQNGSQRPPRMEDVAKRAGVAIGTVSHVLNHPHKVRPDTLERVRSAIDELGFVPDRRARALAAGTSSVIGFVVVDLSNSFFLDMARGAEQEAQKHGMNVLLANSDVQAEKELVYMHLFDEERVAGILLAPLPTNADDVLSAGRWGRDVVVLNTVPGETDACCVTANNELGGYLAARHLIDTGRRALAFVGGPFSLSPVSDRFRGVERAVAESNGHVSLTTIKTANVQEVDGRKAGRQIAALDPGELPDGIVAAADLVALGIVQAFRTDGGPRVPADVSVIGYDNNRAAWDSDVPLSTVAQPGEEMGRAATRLLLEEIRSPGEHRHQRLHLEPTLIVRQSSTR